MTYTSPLYTCPELADLLDQDVDAGKLAKAPKLFRFTPVKDRPDESHPG